MKTPPKRGMVRVRITSSLGAEMLLGYVERAGATKSLRRLLLRLSRLEHFGHARKVRVRANEHDRKWLSTFKVLATPIEELDLTTKPRKCLEKAGINTVGELIDHTALDLFDIPGFGQKSLDEVRVKLAAPPFEVCLKGDVMTLVATRAT